MIKRPLFWMDDQSGRMKEIVMKFLESQKLNDEELNFKMYKPMNIFDYLPSDKINQEVI